MSSQTMGFTTKPHSPANSGLGHKTWYQIGAAGPPSLSQSQGRWQSELERKGRLSPHLVLGCLLVTWLREPVILVNLLNEIFFLQQDCSRERQDWSPQPLVTYSGENGAKMGVGEDWQTPRTQNSWMGTSWSEMLLLHLQQLEGRLEIEIFSKYEKDIELHEVSAPAAALHPGHRVQDIRR